MSMPLTMALRYWRAVPAGHTRLARSCHCAERFEIGSASAVNRDRHTREGVVHSCQTPDKWFDPPTVPTNAVPVCREGPC